MDNTAIIVVVASWLVVFVHKKRTRERIIIASKNMPRLRDEEQTSLKCENEARRRGENFSQDIEEERRRHRERMRMRRSNISGERATMCQRTSGNQSSATKQAAGSSDPVLQSLAESPSI